MANGINDKRNHENDGVSPDEVMQREMSAAIDRYNLNPRSWEPKSAVERVAMVIHALRIELASEKKRSEKLFGIAFVLGLILFCIAWIPVARWIGLDPFAGRYS